MQLPHTASRVRRATPRNVNESIWQRTVANVERMADADPQAIGRRLGELDREWDIERTLEANAATVSLIGLGLAAAVNRRWLALPTVVAGFLLQHALQGWCPPVSIFRRRGVRTMSEIELERNGLRAMRGDFEGLPVRENGRINVDATMHRLQALKGGPKGP